jgi:hypothetical protein
MKVGYSGELGTATGTIHYRHMGDLSYVSAAMTQGTGDTLQYTCPAAQLTIDGLEYYFEISRGTSTTLIGRAATPRVLRVQLTNEECQSGATPTRSYRMISVPVNVAAVGSNTVQTVFSDDFGAYNIERWRLGRYNSATGRYVEYPNCDPVIPGRAYWLITASSDTYGSAGVSVRPNRTAIDSCYYEVDLSLGWNQLANPFPFNVAWADVLFDDNGVVKDHSSLDGVIDGAAAYEYNGSSYVTTTVIDVWGGVFVNCLKTGVTAMFECRDAGPSSKPVSGVIALAAAPRWEIELSLQAGDKGDVANYAGVHAEALEGDDKYDYHEPPMAPEGVRLAFRIPGENSPLRRADYRPEFTNGATWEVVFSEAADRRLSASGLDQIPEGMQAWLMLDKGTRLQLREGVAFALPGGVKSARLVIGTDSYVAGEVSGSLPKEFALSQNYPNPFNPSTTVGLALPKASHVRLVVYNTLGQKVATLVDGYMDAGHHTVVWEGRNDGGQQVASGVYFYRLDAGEFHQTRKMMLLK